MSGGQEANSPRHGECTALAEEPFNAAPQVVAETVPPRTDGGAKHDDYRLASFMPASSCVEPRNLRILVCDSDQDSANQICNILQDCSYNVEAVRTSKQAIAKLDKGEKFDLILKEHQPPTSNACRMLRKIWKDKVHRNIPIVVLSNRHDSKIIQECLQHGAADYMIKPMSRNEAKTLWIRVWTRILALQFDPLKPPQRNKNVDGDRAPLQQEGESEPTVARENEEQALAVPDQRPGTHEDGRHGVGDAIANLEAGGNNSGSSTASDNDGDSREGSNPNQDQEGGGEGKREGLRGVNIHASNGNGSGSGSGSGADCMHMTILERTKEKKLNPVCTTTDTANNDNQNNKRISSGGGTGNGVHSQSAFQAFNSPRKRNKGDGGPETNTDSGNGKNAGSNVTGPQHGTNGTNGSNGQGSNANGNNGSNGASSRHIVPKGSQEQPNSNTPSPPSAANDATNTSQPSKAEKGASMMPQPLIKQQSGPVSPTPSAAMAAPQVPHEAMTLTPYGPMPTNIAQSMFWNHMAAQQQQEQMNYLATAMYANQNMLNPAMNPMYHQLQHQMQQRQVQPMPKEQRKLPKVRPKSEAYGMAGSQERTSGDTAGTNTGIQTSGGGTNGGTQTTTTTLSTQTKCNASAAPTGTASAGGTSGAASGSMSSAQERRAAALDKFRQKKKNLCFSKKIRYASRKQLAEARPRSKGQFVRCNEKQTASSVQQSEEN